MRAAASAIDAAIQKKVLWSGLPRILASRPLDLEPRMKTLIISNKEMNDVMKIVNSLEESSLLIKVLPETIKNEAKEEKGGFLGVLLVIFGASLLGNLLAGKDTTRSC